MPSGTKAEASGGEMHLWEDAATCATARSQSIRSKQWVALQIVPSSKRQSGAAIDAVDRNDRVRVVERHGARNAFLLQRGEERIID